MQNPISQSLPIVFMQIKISPNSNLVGSSSTVRYRYRNVCISSYKRGEVNENWNVAFARKRYELNESWCYETLVQTENIVYQAFTPTLFRYEN